MGNGGMGNGGMGSSGLGSGGFGLYRIHKFQIPNTEFQIPNTFQITYDKETKQIRR
jgi:hypothetical protein